MLIDFANDFADLLVRWTGQRATSGTTDNEGNYAPGAATELTFMATHVQPLKMNELRQTEAGEYNASDVKTYTPFALLPDDVVTYRGVNYQVRAVDDREPLGRYYKAILRKVQTHDV